MNIALDLTVTMGVIVTVVIAIVGWVQMGRKATNDRIASTNGRLDRHEHRISTVEQTVMGLPGKDDLHDLRIALEGLRGDMKEVRAAQAAAVDASRRQEVVIQRVEQHLLQEKSGK